MFLATHAQTIDDSLNPTNSKEVTSIIPIPDFGVYLGIFGNDGDDTKDFHQINRTTKIHHATSLEFFDFPGVIENPDLRKELKRFLKLCIKKNCKYATITLQPQQMLLNSNDKEVTWDKYKNKSIKKFARYLANNSKRSDNTPLPIMLRWAHEMNGDWFLWGQQPKEYKKQYRRFARIVHKIAPNVAMVWAPNAEEENQGNIYKLYYPGDEYVDWVGISFFHWGWDGVEVGHNEIPEEAKWAKTIVSDYNDLQEISNNKPMMIGETAAYFEYKSNNDLEVDIKTKWLNQVYDLCTLARDMPNLKAINWFSVKKKESPSGEERIVDWRIHENKDVLAVYQDLVQNENYFIKADNIALNTPPDCPLTDKIVIKSFPSLVESNKEYDLTVTYTASQLPVFIRVSFEEDQSPYKWHSGSCVRKNINSDSITLNVKIDNEPPIDLDYQWTAYTSAEPCIGNPEVAANEGRRLSDFAQEKASVITNQSQ